MLTRTLSRLASASTSWITRAWFAGDGSAPSRMRPALEGTVGGHWGLLDAQTRAFKFVWGEAVSNHPLWKLQAAGGIAFAVLVLAAGWLARSGTHAPGRWLAVTVNATTGGLLIPWSIANVPVESLGIGGWARSLARLGGAALQPPLL